MFTRQQLRALFESVLKEVSQKEKEDFIEMHEQLSDQIRLLPDKWITWLMSRFGKNPTREETHTIEDALPTIKKFSKKDAAIGQKYANSIQFKEAVDQRFPPDSRSWRTPNDPTAMSIDDMEMILNLSEMKKQRIRIDDNIDVSGDLIGRVGPWNLWMPSSRENSVKIAEYDPITREPKTTWCTARTAGSNLFYNYVGRGDANIVLFYVIKPDPRTPDQKAEGIPDPRVHEDWISIGFIDGKPYLKGDRGSLTVDALNEGLTQEKLQSIFGSYYDEIMGILEEKIMSSGGTHPAKKKITDAAQSIEGLEYLLRGLSKEEAVDVKKIVAAQPNANMAVLEVLASDKDEEVRRVVAFNCKGPLEILKKLAVDPDKLVRRYLFYNTPLDPELLKVLLKDPDVDIRSMVAAQENLTPDLIQMCLNDEAGEVKQRVILSHKLSSKDLAKLADDPDVYTRTMIVKNKAISKDLLSKLSDDREALVRTAVANQTKTPPEILEKLADDKDEDVIAVVAHNKNSSSDVLRKLADRNVTRVSIEIAAHKNVSEDILEKLASDPDIQVKIAVARNQKTPADALRALVKNSDKKIRLLVAQNTNTPIDVLQTLAADKKNARAQEAAMKNLQDRQQALNERRLRHLIRLML